MTEATRDVTVRDFMIFQLKLLMDGLKDLVLFNLSIGAVVLDILSGKGRRPRLFYSVLRASERFDLWLNLNGAVERLDETDDGLFGASAAGSDTMLGKLEQMVRGGDEPRGRAGRRGGGPGDGDRSAPRDGGRSAPVDGDRSAPMDGGPGAAMDGDRAA